MFNIYRSQSAVSPLHTAWENADSDLRNAILRATRQLDQQLQQNPLDVGESREPHTRVLFCAPLAIQYEVDEDHKLVRILRAWTYRGVHRNAVRRTLSSWPPFQVDYGEAAFGIGMIPRRSR